MRRHTGKHAWTYGVLAALSGILTTTGILPAGPNDPPPPVPIFNAADFQGTTGMIDHAYWPMEPGQVWVYEGETEDGFERIVVTASEETRVVTGVTCRVVVDRAYLDGQLTEETYDWYAQDTNGNVWYFGEESYEIEDGEVVSMAGSWEAGVDGALPGHIMLADPQIGDDYRQEYYAGEAEDMAEVVALDATVTLGDGTVYSNVLKTIEWTPLEPGAVENKYYVEGVGMVREESEDGEDGLDLARYGIELKTGKLIVEHNATDEDTGFQGFLDSEGWRQVTVTGPEGETNLTFEAHGKLANLGLTELFFETVEPENVEEPISNMMEKLPEGGYLVAGATMENGESEGDTAGIALLTHAIPEGPELLTPAEEEVVSPTGEVVVSWLPVTEDLEGEDVEIVSYQLIIEKVAPPHRHMIGKMGLSAYLPADVISVTLPPGFLEADTDYEWEVLAIEEGGNQTLSSSIFTTRPGGVEEPGWSDPEDPPNLKTGKLIVEHNATDEDTGFQGFVDGEGWRDLAVSGPGAVTVLTFRALGELGELGLTELFFETVEPENAEVPISNMLAKLPAGDYTIAGTSMQNGDNGGPTAGTALLTHVIPAGAELLTPAEEASVPADYAVMSWEPVTENIDGGPVNIIAYQLIVETTEEPHEHMIGKIGFQAYVSSNVTELLIPRGVLEPGTEYEWEVLAIEESGNQTLSSGEFETLQPLVVDFGGGRPGDSTLSWQTVGGHRYRVEFRESLGAEASWTAVGYVDGDGTRATYDIAAIMAANPKGYFRITNATF